MDKELLEKSYILKDTINNSVEVQELNKAEKLMENNDEVMALSYRFSCAQTEYNDILKIYKENSDEAKASLKKLYESKKVLEEHPLVRDYLSKYSIVRKILNEVDDCLFGEFKLHGCDGSCKHEKGN